MALQALINLSISPVSAVVKIGDTAVDIAERLNGGMWSVGVALTENEVGLSAVEWAELPATEQARLPEIATGNLRDAGAHYVIDSLAAVIPVLDDIEQRLTRGETP